MTVIQQSLKGAGRGVIPLKKKKRPSKPEFQQLGRNGNLVSGKERKERKQVPARRDTRGCRKNG